MQDEGLVWVVGAKAYSCSCPGMESKVSLYQSEGREICLVAIHIDSI